jgi:hypothetical protein|tara:strand:- start:76 stop:297 length:222 start_codon:yes stop_codon:yes gene_type:complete
MNDNTEIYRVLGRLESKVDSLLEENRRFENTMKDANKRITRLEHDRTMVYGAATVLGVIGSAVIWIISKLIST